MELKVIGRGKIVAETKVYGGLAVVRLDDTGRPEWWAEVSLTPDQLRALLAEATAGEGEQ